MTTPAPRTPDSGGSEYIAGLYWRKNPVNGFQCVPAILHARNGQLRMCDKSREQFVVPVDHVRVKVSKFGTLVLRLPDKKYVFVGRGGSASPDFTPQMKQHLLDQIRRMAAEGTGQWSLGAVDELNEFTNVAALTRNTKVWKDVLASMGAQVD